MATNANPSINIDGWTIFANGAICHDHIGPPLSCPRTWGAQATGYLMRGTDIHCLLCEITAPKYVSLVWKLINANAKR